MSYRVIQWATGRRGPRRHGGRAGPSRARTGRGLGAQPRQGGHGPRHAARAERAGGHRHRRRRRAPGHRGRLRALQPDLRRSGRGGRHPRVGQERGDAAGLVLPAARRAAEVRRHRQEGRRDPARHRHQPGRDHGALPADDLGLVRLGHPRSGGGVLRHPHLRRPRRRPRLDAVRQDARRSPGQRHDRRRSGVASASRSFMVADEMGFDVDPQLPTTP